MFSDFRARRTYRLPSSGLRDFPAQDAIAIIERLDPSVRPSVRPSVTAAAATAAAKSYARCAHNVVGCRSSALAAQLLAERVPLLAAETAVSENRCLRLAPAATVPPRHFPPLWSSGPHTSTPHHELGHQHEESPGGLRTDPEDRQRHIRRRLQGEETRFLSSSVPAPDATTT